MLRRTKHPTDETRLPLPRMGSHFEGKKVSTTIVILTTNGSKFEITDPNPNFDFGAFVTSIRLSGYFFAPGLFIPGPSIHVIHFYLCQTKFAH